MPSLDRILPDGGMPRGQVIELALAPGAGLGTSLALLACRAAQKEALAQGQNCWCAFVDPSASLYAPAVLEKGIELKHLLVVRPSLEALTRVVLRLAEAKAFSVIVVDTLGHIGENRVGMAFSQHWVRIIRRLSLAIEGSHTQVILLTDKQARRTLPLPVGLRLELKRKTVDVLEVRVSKEKRGRISEPQRVQIPKSQPLNPLRLLRPIASHRKAPPSASQRIAANADNVQSENNVRSEKFAQVLPLNRRVTPMENSNETQQPLFPEHFLRSRPRASH